MHLRYLSHVVLACLLFAGCGNTDSQPEPLAFEGDPHSYSNPDVVRVRHLDLDLEVLFEERTLRGTAVLTVERRSSAGPLVLDTRGLTILKTETSAIDGDYKEAKFQLGPSDPILGTPLSIPVPVTASRVRVEYTTSPGASALQWLAPEQTAGKRRRFLYTQSQAIHARSWIPLQDSPGVKITYSARVRAPKGLMAVMSAGNAASPPPDGVFRFDMPQPIPSYLIALAVGELAFRELGGRTGVYAEPPVIESAAREFEDTEKMLQTAERLFGAYRWGRYDILVLPPSFPYGGMENPRLTFATPTVIAGDKSLVALVAHELAHSWSGNLVTNATWMDFWLNEGFTVYLEGRILEEVYGRRRAGMEAVLGRQNLDRELARLPDKDEILHADLRGRDPDDGITDIPYEKGALMLRTLEQAYGREPFDAFLLGYFDHFAFQSITSAQFAEYLGYHLAAKDGLRNKVPVKAWVYEPGIPAGAWQPPADVFSGVDRQAERWLSGSAAATVLETRGWVTQEWLRFLYRIAPRLNAEKMAALDREFHFTGAGNSEILSEWLLLSVRHQYHAAYPRLETFLVSIGRRKFLTPLYEELVKTPEGRERALAIYGKARGGYHPISAAAIDAVFKP